jgi:hypothetical protein
MSRYKSIKIGISIFIVIVLLMAVMSTAQAEPPSKVQPSPLFSDGLDQNGKDKNNASANSTSATHVPPGLLKLGKLKAPPVATLHNLTATIKANNNGVVDKVRLTMAKKTASQKISLIIHQLELYKKQISHSRLGNDEKAAAIAVADKNIAWYRQQESEIQASDDIETINALAAGTNLQTDQLKVNMKKEAGIMACDQLDSRIATARNVSAIATRMIAELKASGNDAAALESRLADYGAHIDAASQYAYAARTAFEGISSETNADSGFNAGYQQIRLADLEMGKAFNDLKNFYMLYLHSTHIK